jgi:hypothetical protein
MAFKWEPSDIELLKTTIDANEYQERLERITEILYEYYCQLQKDIPTEDEDCSNLSTENERTA